VIGVPRTNVPNCAKLTASEGICAQMTSAVLIAANPACREELVGVSFSPTPPARIYVPVAQA
jgi:hypothetical protein